MIDNSSIPHLLAQQIGCFPSVEKVILFGSRARGDFDATSDIDLAVSCPTADYDEWRMIRMMRETPLTLRKVDVVRYHTAPLPLKEAIDTEGVLLFERSRK